MKALSLILLLFAASITHAQKLQVVPVEIQGDDQFPKTIRFFCTQKYPRQRCVRDAITLQLILRRYSVANLGVWNFVMATSDEWKNLVSSLGGITGSPAFSVVGNRTTVLEEALFSPLGQRRAELIRMFGTVDRDLLEKAFLTNLAMSFAANPTKIRRLTMAKTFTLAGLGFVKSTGSVLRAEPKLHWHRVRARVRHIGDSPRVTGNSEVGLTSSRVAMTFTVPRQLDRTSLIFMAMGAP